MPLRCQSINGEIQSFSLNEQDWLFLKENYKQLDLKMVCCGKKAIPKTSKLGTFFFAHWRKGECTSAPESKEHLLIKCLVAKAAHEEGWNVTTEYIGEDDEGNGWVADVIAQKDNIKIVFEIQWSKQDNKETFKRQKRYKKSGVRCLWLFKQKDFLSSKNTPVFNIAYRDENDIAIRLPSFYHPDFERKDDDHYWQQEVPIKTFIQGALSRKLIWQPAIGKTFPLMVHGDFIKCWNCKEATRIVNFVEPIVTDQYKHHPKVYLRIDDFENCLDVLREALPLQNLLKYKVGEIKKRYSKTAGEEYVSNGCYHCGVLQGRFFEHGTLYGESPFMESKITITEDMMRKLEDVSDLKRWYFVDQ